MPVTDATDDRQPLILFDGECNLCNGWVQFVIKRDPSASFRFAALQSDVGRRVLGEHGLDEVPESIVLARAGELLQKSSAALAIAQRLRWPWPLFAAFWIVPRPLRDVVYNWIARNRYRWFGKTESCWVPTPELRARFADADERS